MSEEWRDICGFEGLYQVSDRGRVKSLDKTVSSRWDAGCTYPERVLKTSGGRYSKVILSKDSKGYCMLCHRLVAKAFIPNPEGKPQINHIDGDRRNNCVENLEWCDARENANHAFSMGLRKSAKGEGHGRHKVTEEQAREIRFGGRPLRECAEDYGITYSGAYQIRAGYKWKFLEST